MTVVHADRAIAKKFFAGTKMLFASQILTAPVDVFIKSVWEHQQPLFGLLPYTVQPSWIGQHSTIGVRRKLRKDVGLRSARLVEKVRGFTRRALFNRTTTSRV